MTQKVLLADGYSDTTPRVFLTINTPPETDACTSLGKQISQVDLGLSADKTGIRLPSLLPHVSPATGFSNFSNACRNICDLFVFNPRRSSQQVDKKHGEEE